MIKLFRAMFHKSPCAYSEPVYSALERACDANKAVAKKADDAIERLLSKIREQDDAGFYRNRDKERA